MEYPTFTVNFPVILVSVMVTVVVGIIALVLNSLKKRRLALDPERCNGAADFRLRGCQRVSGGG
ncbi:heme exporter protein D [Arthrobacter pascens]|nr:heme exporter protein D [Arthrobacter pascens]